ANTAVRVAGFLLVLVASCALTTLHWQPGVMRQSAGGVVGSLIGDNLAAALNFLGATLLLIAAWMAGLSLAFGVSWFTIMDRTGALAWSGLAWLRTRRSSSRELAEGRERRQARKEAVAAENLQKKVAPRSPPRIEAPVPAFEKSARAERERQVPLFDPPKASELPPLKLLDDPPPREPLYSPEALEALSRLVEMKLKDFGIEAEVVAVQPGPVVTRFELRPAPGVKASQITALAKDLARALSVLSVRVVEVIPGKSVMGLEIANEKREVVTLGEIIRSKAYDEMHSPLALALGKDIGGQPVVADLTRMPHLLIAGTTGSGKSVGINAMVLSLLYKSTAEHVRLIMIYPKMLELSVYEGIPHLLAPVVTDMRQASAALHWCVGEMDRRYKLMSALAVRNLAGYNQKVREAIEKKKPIVHPFTVTPDDPETLEPMPLIVVLIDELADLMMVQGKKVEELIARLAQKSRACGIHLILATQRPSVDVITGLIKANVPTRIAFQVSSKVDSRTILDQQGAESLLGQGDMLYLTPGHGMPTRVHGAYVGDAEVHRVVDALKKQGAAQYLDEILEMPDGAEGNGTNGEGAVSGEADPLYDQAVQIVLQNKRASISLVQRHLRIGYNRAARLIEQMERAGMVSSMQTNGNREVLVPVGKEA
ncbi:MAG: DNA translocase FtsK, partial [Stellaceae bacterium]